MMRCSMTGVVWASLAFAATGCAGEAPSTPTGRLAIDVAPLNLSGVTNADYTVAVTNGPNGTGEVVWTRALTSQRYGDGAGSLSYVGSCDAATGVNTVTLTLTALYDVNGLVPVGTFMNPTPIARQATCVANTDVAVQFDITLARQADQGFFDVAVQFRDIFCSAKLDCQDADGDDLDLLHNAAGARDMTVVMGFACTGSLTGTTFLYLDDPVIHCAGLGQDVRVDPTGLGNVSLTTAPSANASGYLFGASVYRGVEGFAGKAYWNLSFGLDATTFAAAQTCVLTARGTASDVAFPQEPGGFPLPEGSVYPVIDWQVTLSDATHRVCTTHAVNQAASGVATNYLGYLPRFNGFSWSPDPVTLKHRFEPASGIVLSAGTPICNPSCAHGVCTATDTCQCAGTGYGGPTCAIPLCAAACEHGGVCVAPDTCDCAGTGYVGATCADDVDECAALNGGCDQNCANSVGGFACACGTGYLLNADGHRCDDVNECDAGNGGCAQGCTNTSGGYACSCGLGYLLAGDLHGCEDVDECATGNGGCSALASCANTAGSFTCTCNSGYVGDGVVCADIDECATNHGGCDANAACANTAGSHSCTCNAGYVGDGVACLPVIDGACGSASGASSLTAPSAELCAAGTATAVSGTGPFTWSCTGHNTGTTAACSSNKSCAAQTLTWSTSCSAARTEQAHGFSASLTNTAAGYSGAATSACTQGAWSTSATTCNAIVNGACGAAHAGSTLAAPSSGLCTTGTPTTVAGTGPFTWSCTGAYTGTTAACTANKSCATQTLTWSTSCSAARTEQAHGFSASLTNTAAGYSGAATSACTQGAWSTSATSCNAIVNGACGAANAGSTLAAPSTGLCTTGTPTTVAGTGPFTWSCTGAYTGTTAACTANKSCAAQTLTWSTSCSASRSSQSHGFSASLTNTAAGYSGAATSACTQGAWSTSATSCNAIVNGACGAANAGSTLAAPSTGLCTTGTPTTVAGTGPFTWSCTGAYTGTTAACSSNKSCAAQTLTWSTSCSASRSSQSHGFSASLANTAAGYSGAATSACTQGAWSTSATTCNAIVNGACGAANAGSTLAAPSTGLCTTGTPTAVAGTGPFTWSCTGAYTGTTAACTANKSCATQTLTWSTSCSASRSSQSHGFTGSLATTTAGYTGSATTLCTQGAWSTSAATCADVNECATNNGGCSTNATCTNTAGSRTCTCFGGTGYGNGLTCTYYASCLAARQAGVTASAARYVDPDGAGAAPASNVWCDMTSDGGGYTFLKVLQGSAYSAAQAEAYCDTLGMSLFIPRSPAHFTSAWQVAKSTTYGADADAYYLRIMGIYPTVAGATCLNTPLRSGNPSCAWVASDGGNFFVSSLTTVAEPNGNNSPTASMYYDFDASGVLYHWDDLITPAPTSARFMCDVGDKEGVPQSCADWRALGYTASGTYTIDPDANGANAAFSVYCDMTTDGGGWTLVQNSTFAAFDNTPFIGTATVCSTYPNCTTGGTSNIFTSAQVHDFLFKCDYAGNIATSPQVSFSMYQPANYNRGQGQVLSLWQVFTDARRGTTAAGETVSSTNAISYGSAGGRDNTSGTSAGAGWFEGNYHDMANNESFQLNGANWGHHHYTFIIPTVDSTSYHYSYLCGSKGSNSPWSDTEKANARWSVFVR